MAMSPAFPSALSWSEWESPTSSPEPSRPTSPTAAARQPSRDRRALAWVGREAPERGDDRAASAAARRAAFANALRASRRRRPPPPPKALFAAPQELCANKSPFLDPQKPASAPSESKRRPPRAAIKKKIPKAGAAVEAVEAAEAGAEAVAETKTECLCNDYQRVISHCDDSDAVRDAQGLKLDLAWRQWEVNFPSASDVNRSLRSSDSAVRKICREKLITALKSFPEDNISSKSFTLRDVPPTRDLVQESRGEAQKKNKNGYSNIK